MKNYKVILGIIFWGVLANAQVDVRQGSYQDSFLDFIIKNSENDFRLQRFYSSRSLNKGWFGWGWCSNLEAKLSITQENQIDYKDCDLEISFQKTVNNIWQSKEYPEFKIKKFTEKFQLIDIDNNIKEFNLNGELLKTVDRAQRWWKVQYFTTSLLKEAHVIIENKEGFYIKLQKNKEGLVSQVELRAPTALVLHRKKDEVRPKSWTFYYSYEDQNLKAVSEEKMRIYSYNYSHLRNLTHIIFEDQLAKKIIYEEEYDRVSEVQSPDGCKEVLNYWVNPINPFNNYRTHYKKFCQGKLIQSGAFEFNYDNHPVVGRYLKNMEIKSQNKVRSIEFNPVSGRPIERSVSNHF